MSTRSSNSNGFVREPGDWPCSQCREINFKSRTACRRCATPRDHSGPSNSASNIAKPGDWTCPSCNNLNFAARTACNKCGRQKQAPTASASSATIEPKPGDWICSYCQMNNFAARTECFNCRRQKSVPMKVDPKTTIAAKPGDWKCSSCPDTNFGSRVVCRSCGAARPSTEATNQKNECVVCMENLIDSVITTCGHSALCLQCGSRVNSCPICRITFNQEQLIKLYNVH